MVTRAKSVIGWGPHIAISALIETDTLPPPSLPSTDSEERAIYKPGRKPSPGLSMLLGTLGLDMKPL